MELGLLDDVVLEYILFSSTESPIPHPLAGASMVVDLSLRLVG